MTIDILIGRLNAIRVEVYRILSECFKEPDLEFATDRVRGRLERGLSDRLLRLGITLDLSGLAADGEPGAVLDRLREEYYPLFVGPFPPFAPPVESLYKDWGRKDEAPVMSAGVRGMIMGDPAVDMLRRYRSRGIGIPDLFKDTPDHLALLLEYMALLCESGTPEERERFLRDHLDWVPELRTRVYECSESLFYRTVLDAADAFLVHERRMPDPGEKRHDRSEPIVGPP